MPGPIDYWSYYFAALILVVYCGLSDCKICIYILFKPGILVVILAFEPPGNDVIKLHVYCAVGRLGVIVRLF